MKKEMKIVFYNGTTSFVEFEIPAGVDFGNIKGIFPIRTNQEMVFANKDAYKKVIPVVYVNGKATRYDEKVHKDLKVYQMSHEKASKLNLIKGD